MGPNLFRQRVLLWSHPQFDQTEIARASLIKDWGILKASRSRQADLAGTAGLPASFLAVAYPTAHPALLAPHFATSFTSTATGHAFSSGGIGDETMHEERNGQKVLDRNQNGNSIPKAPGVSRSRCGSF